MTTPTELTGRANHLKASPADEMSWRPLQRSTRVMVAPALLASLYYLVFLLNPHYRGDTWLWLVVLAAEGLTVFQALGPGGRSSPTATSRPRRACTTGAGCCSTAC